jgi:hypothetical protein
MQQMPVLTASRMLIGINTPHESLLLDAALPTMLLGPLRLHLLTFTPS